jgi:hypothetical protein
MSTRPHSPRHVPGRFPGVLASAAGPLADAGISVFAVAAHRADHLLVPDLPAAATALAGVSPVEGDGDR